MTLKSRQSITHSTIKNGPEMGDSSLALEIKANQIHKPLFSFVAKSIKPAKSKKDLSLNDSFSKTSQLYSKISSSTHDLEPKYFRLLDLSQSYNSRDEAEGILDEPSLSQTGIKQHRIMQQYVELFRAHIKSNLNISVSNKIRYSSKEKYIKELRKLEKNTGSLLNQSMIDFQGKERRRASKSMIAQSRQSINESRLKAQAPSKNFLNPIYFSDDQSTNSSQKSLIPPVRRPNRDLSLCSWATDHSESRPKFPNIHVSNNHLCP
ncbi:unnamed protein product [Blepharisma stoltei]|uniref:Uncharacterized protein n=1 Tax=Blepharisma stoltei TaxID=1481888 RepID=A0AAU9KEU6_9CILI|nr:unnamed protein product [Blepharisma stoltei]